jgi:hypothetical protein
LIILDGHGGRNGRFVAEIAKTFLEKYFSENILLLLENTHEYLNIAYSLANEEIKKSLKEKTIKENRIVKEVDGYLTSGYNSYSHSLISGGTTCTIVVIIDNIHMYVSNIGDSDAILFTTSNISSKVITDVKLPFDGGCGQLIHLGTWWLYVCVLFYCRSLGGCCRFSSDGTPCWFLFFRGPPRAILF